MARTLEPTDGDTAVYRSAVESSLDGVLVTLSDGRILYANPAACQILGADEADIRRRGRQGFSDPGEERWRDALEERRLRGSVRAVVPMRRADGGEFLAEISSREFTAPDASVRNVVNFRDVTARARLEQHLRASDEITRALLAGTGTPAVLTMVARHARVLMGASEAAVFTAGEAEGTVVISAADGPGMTRLLGRAYPPGSLASQVMASRHSRLIDDLTAVAPFEDGRRLGLGPAMAAPIVSGDWAFGNLLVAAGPQRRPFGPDDLRIVETFAHSAGVALALDRARSDVEEHHRRTAAQLEVALENRVVVEQAKGFLSAVRDIDPEEAFEQIRSYARSHRMKAQEVARTVMERRLLP